MVKKGISVGLIIEENTNYVYAISSIMCQKYEKYEIICLLNENTGISAYDILECIRVQKNEKIVRTCIISKKIDSTFEDNVKILIRNSKEDGIIIFCSRDSFYDNEVLTRLSDLNVADKIVNLKTVKYMNKYNVYSRCIKLQNTSCHKIIEAIRKSDSFYIPRSLFGYFEKGVSYISVERRNQVCLKHGRLENKLFPKVILDIREIVTNRKDLKEKKLNYTSSIYIQNILNIIETKGVSTTQIDKEIDCVKKYTLSRNKRNKYGLTESDKIKLYFLEKIKNINKKYFFRKKQVDLLKKELTLYSSEKIRILFLTQEYHLWTSLKSVYDKACEDSRFIVDLVHIPYYHPQKKGNPEDEINVYLEAGYNIKKYDEYSLQHNSPDIIILMKPYENIPEEYMFNSLEKVSARCVYIRYAPSVNFVMNERLIELLFTLSAYYTMWRCLAYTASEYENASKFSYQKGKEWITLGHPRDDLTIEDFSKKDKERYEEYIQLAQGRKIFLWNTAAQMRDEAEIVSYGSFDELGEDIIFFFEKHKDIFLIWRPHPFFFSALQDLWGKEKCEKFWNKVELIDNIYVDRYENYMPAMFSSDAFISDTSSLVDMYISLSKPILLTKKKYTSLEFYDSDFLNSLFVLNNQNDLIEFVTMVKLGEHFKNKEQNEYVYQNYFGKRFPETVAESLLQYVIDEINVEEKKMFIQREDKIGEIIYNK